MSGAAIRHETGFLSASDGVRLFWQGLQPPGESRASVALVHGYNCCSDLLLPMMADMAGAGLACYAIDCRGHGRSEGLPRHVFRFDEYLLDVRTLCELVAARAGDRRVFLFGNSLGGLIVSLHSLFRPEYFRGAVLTAPFFGAAFRVPRLLQLCGRAASALFPTWHVPVHGERVPRHVTLRWWTETIAAQQRLRRQAELLTVPLLMLHGEADGVACPATARSLFERMRSRDKTLRLLPGARHRDLDPERGPAWWGDVREWIACRA